MSDQSKQSTFNFDRTIYITLGVICVVSLFITSYNKLTYTDCRDADFRVKTQQMVAGEIVSFKDLSPDASEWDWTFGDESDPVTEKNALHVYKHPGEYWVKLKVDASCTVRKKITVEKEKKLTNTSLYPSFSIPTTARVGTPIQFRDNTEGAKSWKWSFGESMRVDATTENPTHTYQSSGTKTVTLIVNGKDQFAAKKRITVFAKPVDKPKFDLNPTPKVKIEPKIEPDTVSVAKVPAAPPLKVEQDNKAPEITRLQLEDYLLQVAEQLRKPKTLKPYTCNGYKTRVRANGKDNTLQYLLQDFIDETITISNLEVIKNKKTRCISYIKIDYKKKRIFGIF